MRQSCDEIARASFLLSENPDAAAELGLADPQAQELLRNELSENHGPQRHLRAMGR